jgi:hypothetical protein
MCYVLKVGQLVTLPMWKWNSVQYFSKAKTLVSLVLYSYTMLYNLEKSFYWFWYCTFTLCTCKFLYPWPCFFRLVRILESISRLLSCLKATLNLSRGHLFYTSVSVFVYNAIIHSFCRCKCKCNWVISEWHHSKIYFQYKPPMQLVNIYLECMYFYVLFKARVGVFYHI